MKFRRITPFVLFVAIVYITLCSTSIIYSLNNGTLIRSRSKGESLIYRTLSLVGDTFNLEDFKTYKVSALENRQVLFYTSRSSAYRYGPSIIKNEDGSYDAWFSSPGNNSSQWDWIRYRHSDDGVKWSNETVVLRPTPGSKDQCSVCDPGVIYFNGYYYLAYTSTSDYGYRGTNNSAFVARSKNPAGPYEKWNGNGWGGNPHPILEYKESPKGWGIGEVSFVIKDEQLYIYYTYFNTTGGYTALALADLSENWPNSIVDEGVACPRTNNDSLDVVYVEDEDLFLAFSIENRMTEYSKLMLFQSKDGKSFDVVDSSKSNMMNYAHNMGVAKDLQGHLKIDDDNLIGYAYGGYWGRWSLMMQRISLSVNKRVMSTRVFW